MLHRSCQTAGVLIPQHFVKADAGGEIPSERNKINQNLGARFFKICVYFSTVIQCCLFTNLSSLRYF